MAIFERLGFSRVFKLLILALLIVPCQSDRELENYRDKLTEVSKGNLGDPDIKLFFIQEEEEPENGLFTLATCYNYTLIKYIDVDKDMWYNLSEELKVIMMAHEFIHCQKNFMDHVAGLMPDRCPNSMMNPEIIDIDCYSRHTEMYLEELRNWE